MFIRFFFGILLRSKLVWAVEPLVSFQRFFCLLRKDCATNNHKTWPSDFVSLFSSYTIWGISLLAFLAPSGGSVRICAIFPFQLKANCQSVFRFWVVIKLCARELPTPAQSLETEGNFEGGNTIKFLLYLTYAGKHVEEYEKCRRHPLRLRRQSSLINLDLPYPIQCKYSSFFFIQSGLRNRHGREPETEKISIIATTFCLSNLQKAVSEEEEHVTQNDHHQHLQIIKLNINLHQTSRRQRANRKSMWPGMRRSNKIRAIEACCNKQWLFKMG